MSTTAEAVSTGDGAVDAPCLRKRSIIAAANDLLDEGGLEGLTIRALLKRSGLARRAFYERFAGKDDLVLAVFDETLAESAAFFRQEVATLGEPIDRIERIVIGLILGALDEGAGLGTRRVSAIVREHMRLAQSRPGDLERALRPLLEVIAEQISEGIRTGQLRRCDPVLQARLIYNLVATTIHPELLTEDGGKSSNDRRQRLALEVWEFCRRAIIA
jgi:AcrR family transcriptional regulator